MFVYLLVFAISTFFFYLAQHEGKNVKCFFVLMGILSLSLLAGLRDETIGTDVLYYGKSIFQSTQRFENFSDVIRLSSQFSMEYGYIILNWLIAKLFHNFQIALFVISFITIFYTYKAIEIVPYKNKWEIMLFFDLIYFNQSLNILRQSIAMAIMLYSVAQVVINHKKSYCLLIIPAVLFHKSALICLGIYIIYYIYQKKQGTKLRFLFYALIILSQFLFSYVLVVINKLGILSNKYSFYLLQTMSHSNTIVFSDILYKIMPVILLFLLFLIVKKYKLVVKNIELEVFIVISFITILYGMTYHGGYIERIVWYADIITYLIGVPMLYIELKNVKGFSFVRIFVILLFGMYWFNSIVIKGYNETYPYVPYWI